MIKNSILYKSHCTHMCGIYASWTFSKSISYLINQDAHFVALFYISTPKGSLFDVECSATNPPPERPDPLCLPQTVDTWKWTQSTRAQSSVSILDRVLALRTLAATSD